MIRYKTTVSQLMLIQAAVIEKRNHFRKTKDIDLKLYYLLMEKTFYKVLIKITKLVSIQSVKKERNLLLNKAEAALLVMVISGFLHSRTNISIILGIIHRELLEILSKQQYDETDLD